LSPGPIVQCRNCGLVYVNPIEHPERLANEDNNIDMLIDAIGPSEYQQIYLAEADVKSKLYHMILDRIGTFTGAPGNLLDIGSFLGLFMKIAESRGWQCKGIEPEKDAWRYSVQELGLDVCYGSIRTCDFPPESFDAITMLQVLEHTLDPYLTLRRIHGLLRPNGILVTEVPNIDCLSFKLLGKRHRHFAKHHFTFFTTETLTTLLNRSGYQVLRVDFPYRMISFRLLDFGLSMWYPSIHKLLSPILRLKPVWNLVLKLNLREVVSICAKKT